jgi:uncharacterized DUF497 family protein
LKFSWDSAKASANRAKHGLDFETAELVWDDPLHIVGFDRVEDGEERWWAIGTVGSVAILVVVHTYPDENDELHVRIIGARKATKLGRRRYEEEGA